jgi:hypothetical protein
MLGTVTLISNFVFVFGRFHLLLKRIMLVELNKESCSVSNKWQLLISIFDCCLYF